ncbi:MFS general substrate transporter [Aspergillus ellipticus CBS 707.79]|uniref:MFS general substrate transporter n=1 Tax=Aspergillus ellipticus CBS 707.79 TaxID=1448320 RepID=A0A319DT00_9EURO|nr:MFS general substrate transporter [Aspergillus ellipticus CBS 707.79]
MASAAEPRDAITAVAHTPQPAGARTAPPKFLASVDEERRAFTPDEEKSVLKRIDRRILPLLLGAYYFFQQLDKPTLSQYSWLGSILYLAPLVGGQPLAALLLVKAPTGKLIGTAVLLWGSSLALMAACTDFARLLGLRLRLGAFEAMIAPSCVAVTQMWWRRGEQTWRTALWSGMNGGVTFVIIFLFCGLLTVSYSTLILLLMPDSPMDARFLSPREKVTDLKTWCWFLLILSISIPSGGISTFGNLIIKSFGYGSFETMLFNIPFGAIQVVAILGGGWLATRFQRKGLVIIAFAAISAVGTVLMIVVPRDQKGVLLFGYYLAWEAQNTAGDTKRKCPSAVVLIGICAGNICPSPSSLRISLPLNPSTDTPLYRPGLISNLILFVLVGVFALMTNLYLIYLNRKQARKRRELGKSARVVDESMARKKPDGEGEQG